ncbi:hypothetical protein EVAR_77181_1 [Eumeta japonica]|uniref:Uncharacterized protein n=1 Tax=Eumeta variegata TaxID=151549 RepID=A0A4C1T4V5_EUMVA|nr:hypothetical protein EVAR_77181_1 [Eumeta japonica]
MKIGLSYLGARAARSPHKSHSPYAVLRESPEAIYCLRGLIYRDSPTLTSYAFDGSSLFCQNKPKRIVDADSSRKKDFQRAESLVERTDPEKTGFNAPVVNSGLTKTAQEVILAMFATTATQIDP